MKFVIPVAALLFLNGCVTKRYAEYRYWQGRFDATLDCINLRCGH